MSWAEGCMAAFFAVELAALQRVMGNREHAVVCVVAATAILVATALSQLGKAA